MQKAENFKYHQMSYADGRSCQIAYEHLSPCDSQKPTLMWLQGFRSHMQSEKANYIAQWAVQHGYGLLRFDYSGLGLSEGDFAQATISDWLDEAWELFSTKTNSPDQKPFSSVILLGSSMGGWIALLMIQRLQEIPSLTDWIKGAVMIAPAWDFTEKLIWDRFPDELKADVEKNGAYYHQSPYEEKPFPITHKLIIDGRKYLLDKTGTFFKPQCPIRILHGLKDKDVPWEHSLTLIQNLNSDDIILQLIKDGEHRLSRPQDMQRFTAFIEEIDALIQANDFKVTVEL